MYDDRRYENAFAHSAVIHPGFFSAAELMDRRPSRSVETELLLTKRIRAASHQTLLSFEH